MKGRGALRGAGDAPGSALCGGGGGVCGAQGVPRGLRSVEGGAWDALGCTGCRGGCAVWRGIWSALHCIVVQQMAWGLCCMEGCMCCSGLQGMP